MISEELEFYSHGFHRALKRFRGTTVFGWLLVLAGTAGIPFGWEFGRFHGSIDLALCGGTIIAGLVVVHQSIVSLSTYIRNPLAKQTGLDEGWAPPQWKIEITELMKEVDEGGWQEAYAAIAELRKIGMRHGLSV